MSSLAPGATLGILGGGQLGRMAAMAARQLGFGVSVLDPDPHPCARGVADSHCQAAFDDVAAAAAWAAGTQAVTYEIEKIGPQVLQAVAEGRPLRPGAALLTMVQDRLAQKRWLAQAGFPVGPYVEVSQVGALPAALPWSGPGRLKVCRGGYDGRGQTRVTDATPAMLQQAWQSLGRLPCVLEAELALQAELSVLVARRPAGDVQVFPVAQNWHEDSILRWSVMPAPLPGPLVAEACALARELATTLRLEGLLAVELFWTCDGSLLVNELAPRPHNTFHAADWGCATGQFEQLVRAVADWPLGDTRVLRPCALANLLGDLWQPRPPDFGPVLQDAATRVVLYGKAPRAGRKVGHLLAQGDTPEAAVQAVQAAYGRLDRAYRAEA